MEDPAHILSAEMDNLTASVTCDECAYAFIAPMTERGISLTERVWLDRGDRVVAHSYMASEGQMDDIAKRATHR